MITGWTTDVNDTKNDALVEIYAAYRCRGNVNFVAVDTGQFASLLFERDIFVCVCVLQNLYAHFSNFFVFQARFVQTLYSWSAFNTEEIGNLIADSLKILTENYPVENIHLIGECIIYARQHTVSSH